MNGLAADPSMPWGGIHIQGQDFHVMPCQHELEDMLRRSREESERNAREAAERAAERAARQSAGGPDIWQVNDAVTRQAMNDATWQAAEAARISAEAAGRQAFDLAFQAGEDARRGMEISLEAARNAALEASRSIFDNAWHKLREAREKHPLLPPGPPLSVGPVVPQWDGHDATARLLRTPRATDRSAAGWILDACSDGFCTLSPDATLCLQSLRDSGEDFSVTASASTTSVPALATVRAILEAAVTRVASSSQPVAKPFIAITSIVRNEVSPHGSGRAADFRVGFSDGKDTARLIRDLPKGDYGIGLPPLKGVFFDPDAMLKARQAAAVEAAKGSGHGPAAVVGLQDRSGWWYRTEWNESTRSWGAPVRTKAAESDIASPDAAAAIKELRARGCTVNVFLDVGTGPHLHVDRR